MKRQPNVVIRRRGLELAKSEAKKPEVISWVAFHEKSGISTTFPSKSKRKEFIKLNGGSYILQEEILS